jgi:hypothetical protein
VLEVGFPMRSSLEHGGAPDLVLGCEYQILSLDANTIRVPTWKTKKSPFMYSLRFVFSRNSGIFQSQTLSSLTKNIERNINNYNTKYIWYENIGYENSNTIIFYIVNVDIFS